MPLEYIFPDHSRRNHKIAIVIETVLAVIGLCLIFWAISQYRTTSEPQAPASVVDSVAEQRKLLEKSGPVVTLTPAEIVKRREILNKPGPAVKLTPERVQKMRSVIDSI